MQVLEGEGADGVSGQVAHGGPRAEHGATIRVGSKQRCLETVGRDSLGVVFVAADLLEDDQPLPLELFGVDVGVAGHVDEHVEGLWPRVRLDGRMKAQLVPCGPRIEVAAEALDGGGCPAQTAARRALEQHVLEEVRAAGMRRVLVGRAGVEPQVDRCRGGEGLGFDDQREAVDVDDVSYEPSPVRLSGHSGVVFIT